MGDRCLVGAVMTAQRAFYGVKARLHAIDRVAFGLEYGRVKNMDKARALLARLWASVETLSVLADTF